MVQPRPVLSWLSSSAIADFTDKGVVGDAGPMPFVG
jgi:hypothetical protein